MAESSGIADFKRSINYDALDEKIMMLAERGVLLMSGEIVEGAAFSSIAFPVSVLYPINPNTSSKINTTTNKKA